MMHWSYSSSEYKEGQKIDRYGTGHATRTKTFKAILDALNPSDIIAGSVLAFQMLFMRVKSRYGGSGDHQRLKAMDVQDQVHLEPLTERSRNVHGQDESEYETEYAAGYNAPPMPPTARDPSPGANYGHAQTFRADGLRPDPGYGRSYSSEGQPLQQPHSIV